MQISAPVDVCVTVSVAGPRRDRMAGWFAVAKIVACFCGISQSCAGWFGREAPDKYVLFVLIPGDFFVFRCKLSETAVILKLCMPQLGNPEMPW